MQNPVVSTLTQVRRRQRRQSAIRFAVYGLLMSSGVVIGLALWNLWAPVPVSSMTALAVLLAGPLLGAVTGLAWRCSWQSAAAAVDEEYRLKDRALTAWEFLNGAKARSGEEQSSRSDGPPSERGRSHAERGNERTWPLRELQIDDADQHLRDVEPARVVPMRLPRAFPYAGISLVIAVALLLVSNRSQQIEASPQQPHVGILAVAEDIAEDLDELEKRAEQEQSDELKDLVEELRKEVEAMKKPEVDVREALAKISEMQAAIDEKRAEYNEALVDAQLQSLGSAMAGAQALQGAGEALQESEFDKAAEELEKIEDLELSRREAKTAAERLKKTAKKMSDSGLGQLSGAVSEMSEGLKSGNSGKACRACQRLAKLVRKHGVRRRINRTLQFQLAKLNERKSQCQACQGMCRKCGGQCPPGGQ